jgi:hypothetical protein
MHSEATFRRIGFVNDFKAVAPAAGFETRNPEATGKRLGIFAFRSLKIVWEGDSCGKLMMRTCGIGCREPTSALRNLFVNRLSIQPCYA